MSKPKPIDPNRLHVSYSRVVGCVIRGSRKQTNISRTALAAMIHRNTTSAGRIETGATDVSLKLFSEVAAALRLAPSELMRRIDVMLRYLATLDVAVKETGDLMFKIGDEALDQCFKSSLCWLAGQTP